jgi:hypothetical protein
MTGEQLLSIEAHWPNTNFEKAKQKVLFALAEVSRHTRTAIYNFQYSPRS